VNGRETATAKNGKRNKVGMLSEVKSRKSVSMAFWRVPRVGGIRFLFGWGAKKKGGNSTCSTSQSPEISSEGREKHKQKRGKKGFPVVSGETGIKKNQITETTGRETKRSAGFEDAFS